MTRKTPSIGEIYALAAIAIVPLVAAAWLPPDFPLHVRQIALAVWGVGAMVALERLFLSHSLPETLRALGFVGADRALLSMAVLVSVPMWVFLPIFGWMQGAAPSLRPGWLALLAGVILVNGITEEVIHRGFVFGHLRRDRSFAAAATLSAVLFAAQHLYIIAINGAIVGVSSVILALLLAYPLAFMFERGGRSIAGPAILHTSSNAPMMIIGLPDEIRAMAIVPHMGIVLASMYLVFLFRRRVRA